MKYFLAAVIVVMTGAQAQAQAQEYLSPEVAVECLTRVCVPKSSTTYVRVIVVAYKDGSSQELAFAEKFNDFDSCESRWLQDFDTVNEALSKQDAETALAICSDTKFYEPNKSLFRLTARWGLTKGASVGRLNLPGATNAPIISWDHTTVPKTGRGSKVTL